jgi:hypothetical protein
MKTGYAAFILIVVLALQGCDQRVPQTLIVRANVAGASQDSIWVAESDNCIAEQVKPGWYRDGLWIFRLSTTRGGVGAVTQELALCARGNGEQPNRMWHSVFGGGAPLIVLSCVAGDKAPCRMYQDGYTPGAWSDEGEP